MEIIRNICRANDIHSDPKPSKVPTVDTDSCIRTEIKPQNTDFTLEVIHKYSSYRAHGKLNLVEVLA